MATMGASVTAIDPSRDSIEAAKQHAQKRGAKIDYRAMPLEDLVDEGPIFDGVTLLEVIEHVPDQQAFIDLAAALVRPDGILIVSTISRTAEAYIKAIIAAEYLLGWLPRGTHAWRRFVKPSKMSHMLRRAGLTPAAITGVDYDASRDQFRLCRDPSVNYMMSARKV
jgi:2-polyprenyl-6-hydroxyphenyl methylase/3-demethylubiquinone-9 3-methyltransferase